MRRLSPRDVVTFDEAIIAYVIDVGIGIVGVNVPRRNMRISACVDQRLGVDKALRLGDLAKAKPPTETSAPKASAPLSFRPRRYREAKCYSGDEKSKECFPPTRIRYHDRYPG